MGSRRSSCQDCHSGLGVEIVESAESILARFVVAKLRRSRDRFSYVVHAYPLQWLPNGLQVTDVLSYLGFVRCPCSLLTSDCYACLVAENWNVQLFASALESAFNWLRDADADLEACGIPLPQPEGWGYFLSVPSGSDRKRPVVARTDGHRIPERAFIGRAGDRDFGYAATYVRSERERGIVFHFDSLTDESLILLRRTASFVGGWKYFDYCQEFDLRPCFWRFERCEDLGSAEKISSRMLDGLPRNFSSSLGLLVKADSEMSSFGLSVLVHPQVLIGKEGVRALSERKDVFICHASEDKNDVVEPIVQELGREGISFWYDRSELLWGDRLVLKVNYGLSVSRFVIVVISSNFLEKRKRWPKREMAAALGQEIENDKTRVLPLLVGGDEIEAALKKEYPLLGDKIYLKWTGQATDVMAALKPLLKLDG